MSKIFEMNTHDLSNHTMQPYSRVFALELQQTDIIVKGRESRQTEIITPSGARISRLFACGALTEINRNAKGTGLIRVADPTGVLVIYLKSRTPEITKILDSLITPAFVSVTAVH
jgi:RPA family protein